MIVYCNVKIPKLYEKNFELVVKFKSDKKNIYMYEVDKNNVKKFVKGRCFVKAKNMKYVGVLK